MESDLLLLSLVGQTLYRGFDGGTLRLIAHAGPVVKLVLLLLIFFSVVCWAIIFTKHRFIRRVERESHDFLQVFWAKKDMSSIYGETRRFRNSPVSEIFRAGYAELAKLPKNGSPTTPDRPIPPSDIMRNVQRALKRTNNIQTIRLERYLSFLATTGNSAPFIGLFGTVWGIMEAFQNIGQSGTTSLAIVAPGISEALIATAVGLFAAIPAVIAYNYYLSRIRHVVADMDSFTDEFLNIIERSYR